MTKSFVGLLLAVVVLPGRCLAAAESGPAPGVTVFVAAEGSDAWSGALAEPNPSRTDGPLATLERACEKIRALKETGPLPPGGVEVVVRGGTYYRAQTFRLGKEDSGTATAPVVYRAAAGEKVRLIGGRPIAGFSVDQGSILKTDVASHGFQGIYFRQLFFDGRRQPRARYPNFDPQNPYGGGWAYVDGQPVDMYRDLPTDTQRAFQYKPQDARRWSRPEEGEVFIFPRWNWWNDILRIASVDPATRTIRLAGNASYAIRPGDRYYVQNLREELDAPGEWYLDRRTETLYFWPPAPLEGKLLYAPTMRTLIELGPGTSHVAIHGFELECCEGTAVVLSGTSDCLVAGNTIHNVGDYNGNGVTVDGGTCNGVAGNDVFAVGSNGIEIGGGDRLTLTPAGNYADNNYIHHTGVSYKQGAGILLNGVGNRATHNLIHDCPRHGILFSGNNLVIEFNHIRHVSLETADTGALDTGGRDWISSRGTRIRYNYIHDVLGYGRMDGRWLSPYYSWGIYLDDNTGGVDVTGNIVVRAFRGLINLHNGRDNRVENNIFVDGEVRQVEFDGWTATNPFWTRTLPSMIRGYDWVLGQPAWRAMRGMDVGPREAVLPDGTIMAGNVLRRNIIYYHRPGAHVFRMANVSAAHNPSDYNLVYHFGRPLTMDYMPPDNAAGHDAPADGWPAWWRALGQDRHSLVADPLFVDPDHDDYRLRPESPAWKLGFQPIPVEKIGPYADADRASWPIVEAEGVRERPLISDPPAATSAAGEITPFPDRLPCAVDDRQDSQVPDRVHLTGMIGTRIQRSAVNRLLAIDIDRLLDGFRHRPGRQIYDGEHVGKWLHAATLAWAYTGNAALRAKLDSAVAELVKCQLDDGYLGTYLAKDRWTQWDVWTHKYCLIGLLTYVRYTRNTAPLAACRKMADLLCNSFGDQPGRRDIITAGHHFGMAPTSVLEPMVWLYRLTGEKKYGEFCEYILRCWEQPNGPHIVSRLLELKRVDKVGNGKAYEMLSCINGMLEWYRTTGDPRLLQAALNAWEDIVAKRLYITGTASYHEVFHDDFDLPNTDNVGETCVTVTWLQLNAHLLRLTGQARFAEQLERVVYNQLCGAQRPDGRAWGYYVEMEGKKPYTAALDGHCCLSSGPRGMTLIPTFAMTTDADGLVVNFYDPGEAHLRLHNGPLVKLAVETAYPSSGQIAVLVDPAEPCEFALKLRIPSWCGKPSLRVNGRPADATPASDGYAVIRRRWEKGDKVELVMPLAPRVLAGDHGNRGRVAVLYGPLVLAADASLTGGVGIDQIELNVDTASLALQDMVLESYDDSAALGSTVEPAPTALRTWPGAQVFRINAVNRKTSAAMTIRLVPFADAGATGAAYRVWLPLVAARSK